MTTDDMSELITRGVLKQELGELKQELKQELNELRQEFDRSRDLMLGALFAHMDERFARARIERIEDIQSAVGAALGHMDRNLALAREPTKDIPERVATLEHASLPMRVTKLENADLPGRVTKLEAKVFPPKRARRR